MPATKPTRPSTVQQLHTSTLIPDNPDAIDRIIGDQADAIQNLERRIGQVGASAADAVFTSTAAGDVPASGGGTTNFLRADGTWTAPGAASGVSTVTAGSSKVTAAPTSGAVVVDVVPANFTGIPESGITNLTTDLAAKVPTSRIIAATSPMLIDGGASADLSADRTISILTSYLAGLEAFLFGSGTDGACVFDGAATVLGLVPVANVYTLTRNIYPSSMTVNGGVTIKPSGWMIQCSGMLTLTGTISANGNDAAGATAGTGAWTVTSTYLGGGGNGGGGGNANGTNGGVYAGAGVPRRFAIGANAGVAFGGASGVAGGTGQGGSGGPSISGLTSGGAITQTAIGTQLVDPDDWLGALNGKPLSASGAGYTGGSGGGSGAGDNVTVKSSGGGGGGAGWIVVRTKTITGGGSITAKGGAGGTAAGANAGGGAGGGGGGIVCIAGTGTLPTLDVSGGTAGSGAGTGKNGGAGGAGLTFSVILAA